MMLQEDLWCLGGLVMLQSNWLCCKETGDVAKGLVMLQGD